MIERTVVLVKHDGVQRGLVGEIIKRFEQKGLKMAAIKMLQVTEKQAKKQYRLTPAWIKKLGENTRRTLEERGTTVKETNKQIAKRIHGWLKSYLTEGPIIAMIFEGYHAIEIGRKLVGHAEPRQALPGTIRGDFSVDSYELADLKKRPTRSIVHAAGDKQEAENEIKLYFKKSEIFDYKKKDWDIIH